MKKSLEIISKNPYPIQVTAFYFKGELGNWIKWFQKKKIEINLKPNQNGSFALFRKATPEEIAEIKAGKVIIRGSGFRELRDASASYYHRIGDTE